MINSLSFLLLFSGALFNIKSSIVDYKHVRFWWLLCCWRWSWNGDFQSFRWVWKLFLIDACQLQFWIWRRIVGWIVGCPESVCQTSMFFFTYTWNIDSSFFWQWEALALLLIGISLNQLQSLPAGSTAMGLSVATGAYLYTLIFVCILYTCPALICIDFVPVSH